MIDKRQIIKEHLKDCDPDQLHDGSYVTIKECVEMMELLEQKLVKNLGLHNVIVPKGTVCELNEWDGIDDTNLCDCGEQDETCKKQTAL